MRPAGRPTEFAALVSRRCPELGFGKRGDGCHAGPGVTGASSAARRAVVALLTAAALFQAVPSRADEPVASFVGPVQVTFAGTPDSTDPREFLKQIERTISVDETPLFGGSDGNTAPQSNYFYNSAPFGNCGTLNAIGAALYSSLSGLPYRFRHTSTHVTTEIGLAEGYFVLDSYTGTRLSREHPPGLFTMDQLEHDPSIWTGRRKYAAPLFKGVLPLEENTVIHSYPGWRTAELGVTKGEKLTVRVDPIDLLDLWGWSALDLHDVWWDVRGEIHGPTHLHVATLWRPAGRGALEEHFETPFLISRAVVRPQEWGNGNYALANGVSVQPAAPSWAVDVLAGKAVDWTVVSGHGERTGGEWRVYPANGSDGHLRLDTGYRNDTDHLIYGWLPLLYRTATPAGPGGGNPVGSFVDYAAPGGSRINLYPRNRDTRYADLIFPVAPGKRLVIDLLVFKGNVLDVATATRPPEIKDVLSVTNPAMAVRVTTAKPMETLYDRPVDISFDMLVNPFLEPRAAPVTVSDAPDKRASVR